MREFEFADDIIEIKAEKQEKKSLDLAERKSISPGHICFEYNTLTKSIKQVEYRTVTIDWFDAVRKDYSKCREVVKKPSCIYVTALNEKNALKKINKLIK